MTLEEEVERVLTQTKVDVVREYLTYREFYKGHSDRQKTYESMSGRILFLQRRIIFEQRMSLMHHFDILDIREEASLNHYVERDAELRDDYETLETNMKALGYLPNV